MIVLVLEYPCVACGVAIRIPVPVKPPTLPATLNNLTVPAVPQGWTYDAEGVHCPAHEPRRVLPVGAFPNLAAINGGRKH